MVNVIIILVLVLVIVIAVKSYIGKLRHGCCGGETDGEERVLVQDREPSHYPYCVKIQIQGMTCSNCQLKVENALNRQEGTWAQVDLKAGQALVRLKNPAEPAVLRRLVARAGYQVTEIQDEQA